jgi:hypothetical protein
MRIALIGTLLLGLLLISSCGYHIAGKADLLPMHIQTIAVATFKNATTQYKLTDLIPGALTREFLSRTRYRITADPAQADAVLSGAILTIDRTPTVFNPRITDPVMGKATGTDRATTVEISVVFQIALTERSTNKVIYNQPNLQFRERYEISTNTNDYFDESGFAFQRLSGAVARSIVSAVLEQF